MKRTYKAGTLTFTSETREPLSGANSTELVGSFKTKGYLHTKSDKIPLNFKYCPANGILVSEDFNASQVNSAEFNDLIDKIINDRAEAEPYHIGGCI